MLAIVVAVLVTRSGAAHAGEVVGAVAALEGQAEVLAPGATAWAPLGAGSAVEQGSKLRTLADSKLKVLLADDSVLTLGASSELAIEEQVLAPAPTSRLSLVLGAVRALVTDRYAAPGASFEVETPTAVAGVRGTEFIASYDAGAEESVVVGVSDTTLVRSLVDTAGARPVEVGPGESTTVRRGSYPVPPRLAPDSVVRDLGAATSLATGGRTPEREFQRRPHGEGAAEPRMPERVKTRGQSPEGEAVDQPVDEIKRQGPRKPPPPPPPLPQRR
jgi:hypothetical protein